MSTAPTPRLSRRPTLPLVWIVPLIALAVGGWMIFREFRHRGPEITIDFEDGAGVKPGATVLEYKGVSVGVVRAVELNPDLTGVSVRLQLDQGAAGIATEGAEFWVVQPEIGFSGIKGLDTLLTGVRLKVRPGRGAPATRFKGLSRPPPIENPREGRAFLLQAERLSGLNPGAPVYYREVRVGTVETSRLADTADSVLVRIRIDTPYLDLVRINSRFWNAGGVSFRMSLLGAEVKSTSLESLFSGGVAFATPDTGRQLATVAPEGHVFTLHPEADKDWLKWQPQISIQPSDSAPEPAPEGLLAPLRSAGSEAAARERAKP
ncbi:MAG: MlaD family protein [Opitutaceae bacterium]|nr:MlaD family protein [Opitutaceae bacterium]